MPPRLPSFLLAAGFLLLAGCQHADLFDPARHGPFYTPRNHVGEFSLGTIRRVVLLPVHGGPLAAGETVAALDNSVAVALQQENRFEVVRLSRTECLQKFGARDLASSAALPRGLLARLQEDYAADAVMFVDLTAFSPYRPLTVGFRAKLASIDGTRLVWTFDDVFSSEDPAVVNSVRRHYRTSDRGGVPVDLSPGVLQAPTRFAGYAAATMFSTLPPVYGGPMTVAASPRP